MLFSQLELSEFYSDCFSLLARALLAPLHECVNRSNTQSAHAYRSQCSPSALVYRTYVRVLVRVQMAWQCMLRLLKL